MPESTTRPPPGAWESPSRHRSKELPGAELSDVESCTSVSDVETSPQARASELRITEADKERVRAECIVLAEGERLRAKRMGLEEMKASLIAELAKIKEEKKKALQVVEDCRISQVQALEACRRALVGEDVMQNMVVSSAVAVT